MNFFRTALAAALTASAQVTQMPLCIGTLNKGSEGFTTNSYQNLPNPASVAALAVGAAGLVRCRKRA